MNPANILDAAFKCLFLNRTSFSGALMSRTGPIGGVAQTGQYKIDCRFNRTRLADRVEELSSLADRVLFVRSEHYQDVIRAVRDLPRSVAEPRGILWYLDPPFFAKADRLYRFSFQPSHHEELAASLSEIPGHWILSYDDHPEALRLYESHPGFARVNLQYSARIDDHQRLVASEVLVSDLISDLRESGLLEGVGEIIQLPRCRREKPDKIRTRGLPVGT